MNINRARNILMAVAETLDAVPLRCDEVESAAKISACSRKLKELAATIAEKECAEHEADNKHEA